MRYVMEKKDKDKARDALIEFHRLTHKLMDVVDELGTESGIYRLFGSKARGLSKNSISNHLQIINIKEWKARRNLKD